MRLLLHTRNAAFQCIHLTSAADNQNGTRPQKCADARRKSKWRCKSAGNKLRDQGENCRATTHFTPVLCAWTDVKRKRTFLQREIEETPCTTLDLAYATMMFHHSTGKQLFRSSAGLSVE